MMQTMFIYAPKSSRDRVFAEKAAPGMAIVKWGNGSRHVVGGVHMEWHAAAPGSWWRAQAKTLASAIVGSVGGVAWDDQGSIHLIVPVGVAAKARALMCAGEAQMTSSSDEQEALKRDAALIMAGYRPAEGRLDIGASGLFVMERPVIVKAAADTIAPKAYVWFFGPAPSEDAARPTIASVTAPSTWGPPEVLMPPGAEQEVKHTVLSPAAPAPEEAPGARPELADG